MKNLLFTGRMLLTCAACQPAASSKNMQTSSTKELNTMAPAAGPSPIVPASSSRMGMGAR